ncbi:MAG: B-box zinc finger protein [Caldilineaceae bacterium]
MTETETEVLYCANHPNTETLLRCNKCGKPICMKCAQLTDVGYRCRDCIRTQQKVYFNAESWDNPIAFAVSFVVALIATPILGVLLSIAGFFGWLIAFFAGPSAGGLLTQIIRWAVAGGAGAT